MRRMWDFQCRKCNEVFEEYADPEQDEVPCPVCGTANPIRLIGATRMDPRLGVDAASFPTLGDKWARIRRQRAQIERSRDP